MLPECFLGRLQKAIFLLVVYDGEEFILLKHNSRKDNSS